MRISTTQWHIILTYMLSPAGIQGTASSACAAGSTPCVPISLAASILRRCGWGEVGEVVAPKNHSKGVGGLVELKSLCDM